MSEVVREFAAEGIRAADSPAWARRRVARLEATLLDESAELRRQLAVERARLAVVVPFAAEDLDGTARGAVPIGLVWLVVAVAP